MNRLQKKCFIVSSGVHLSLALTLLIGPAFIAAKNPAPEDMPLLDFIPRKTVDALVSNPGSARGSAPQPVRPPTPPNPPPAPRQPATPQRIDPPQPEQPRNQHRVVPNLTPRTVRNPNRASSTPRTDTQAQARANEAQRRQVDQALSGIRNQLSSSTTIDSPGGGTGEAYANFLQAVKTVYTRAWDVPPGVNDDSATATVSVTIARDGTVVGSRITDPSGNALVDSSVQNTLNRVRYAVPLPDDARESQRTVTIRFNVRAKLLG